MIHRQRAASGSAKKESATQQLCVCRVFSHDIKQLDSNWILKNVPTRHYVWHRCLCSISRALMEMKAFTGLHYVCICVYRAEISTSQEIHVNFPSLALAVFYVVSSRFILLLLPLFYDNDDDDTTDGHNGRKAELFFIMKQILQVRSLFYFISIQKKYMCVYAQQKKKVPREKNYSEYPRLMHAS